MSGYHALRPTEDGNSNGLPRESFGLCGDDSDSPIVLARVADFTTEPDHSHDEPLDASLVNFDDEPAHDELPDDRPGFSLDFCSAARSRLAVGGLVLVAGLCGFLLGRVTSPTVRDSDQWRPAPSASEAPGWDSESVAASNTTPVKSEPPTGQDTPVTAPWNMPMANSPKSAERSPAPTLGHTPDSKNAITAHRPNYQEPPREYDGYGESSPWPRQQVTAPSNTQRQPQWTANQDMALPGSETTSRPSQRPIENAPYADARLARRPTTPTQSNTLPAANSPGYMPKQYPNTQRWAPEKAPTPCHGGPTSYSPVTSGQQNGQPYPAQYPVQSGGINNPQTQVPVQGTTNQNATRYYYN